MSNMITRVNDPYFSVRISSGSDSFIMNVTGRFDDSYDSDTLTPGQSALLDEVMQTVVQAISDRSDVTQATGTRYTTETSYITAT